MTTVNKKPINPVLVFLKQLISFFLIFSSILVGLFLYTETRDIINPPTELQRYNNALVNLYLQDTSSDWIWLHHLEDEVDIFYLDDSTRENFRNKIWENYIRSPQEYRSRAQEDILDFAINNFSDESNRDPEFRAILINRSKHIEKAISNEPLVLTDREQADWRDRLESALYSCEASVSLLKSRMDSEDQNRSNMREALHNSGKTDDEIGKALQGREILLSLDEFYGIRDSVEKCQELENYQKTVYELLSPRYELIVYDSLQRVETNILVGDAKQIMNDTKEDPYLRLLAIDYLQRFDEVDKLRTSLVNLIEDGLKSGAFLDFEGKTAFQENLFKRYVSDALRDLFAE